MRVKPRTSREWATLITDGNFIQDSREGTIDMVEEIVNMIQKESQQELIDTFHKIRSNS